MNNFVIFGTTQSGKSTLAGFIASHTLDDKAFNAAINNHRKILSNTKVGQLTDEMVYISFVSLDTDELLRCKGLKSIGTTKRAHRKYVSLDKTLLRSEQELIMIDTPGVRSEARERYMGIFEGEIGICMISILDLERYESSDEQIARKIEERKIFDPIRFWCAYKNAQSLVIVLSKIDTVKYDSERIKQAIQIITSKLIEYRIPTIIPIIPTAIKLHLDETKTNYIREAHNVVNLSPLCQPPQNQALLPTILKMDIPNQNQTHPELFCSVSKIREIKGRNQYALSVKVLQQVLRLDSKVVIGPVKEKKSNRITYISGQIKSLKEDTSKELSSALNAGSVGGIRFSSVFDYEYTSKPHLSKCNELTDYKILKTTVLTGSSILSGNSITLFVPDDELGVSALAALNNLLPKESVRFLWFGKFITAEVIELYHSNNEWCMTLCPLVSVCRNALGPFTIPVDQENNNPDVESLVVLPSAQPWEKTKIVLNFHNYINFKLRKLRDFREGRQYLVHMKFGKDTLCGDTVFILECKMKDIAPSYKYNVEADSIIVNGVSLDGLGAVMKALRTFIRESAIAGYQLFVTEK